LGGGGAEGNFDWEQKIGKGLDDLKKRKRARRGGNPKEKGTVKK